MFDFWLAMGTLVVDKTFLPSLTALSPIFHRLNNVTITVGSNAPKTLLAAGTLDETSVTTFRAAIHKGLNSRYPDARVTVSLYVAGKLTQVINVDMSVLNVQLPALQALFQGVASATHLPATLSSRFVALLGACLIDAVLAARIGTIGDDTAAQFFLDPSGLEFAAITALVGTQAFKDAQSNLSASATWDFGCFQRFTFYPKFTMFAN